MGWRQPALRPQAPHHSPMALPVQTCSSPLPSVALPTLAECLLPKTMTSTPLQRGCHMAGHCPQGKVPGLGFSTHVCSGSRDISSGCLLAVEEALYYGNHPHVTKLSLSSLLLVATSVGASRGQAACAPPGPARTHWLCARPLWGQPLTHGWTHTFPGGLCCDSTFCSGFQEGRSGAPYRKRPRPSSGLSVGIASVQGETKS